MDGPSSPAAGGAFTGSTAERGVFGGATSYLICAANRQSPAGTKIHHLFDSFEGLSEPAASDGVHWSKGNLRCGIEEVRRALSEFENVEFHKGWIPSRFQDIADRKFSSLHIDVDLTEPTGDSLIFFYPRMEKGGIILCDDYGFSTGPGAMRSIDQFLADKPEKMLALPHGGGFLIVNAPTAKSTPLR